MMTTKLFCMISKTTNEDEDQVLLDADDPHELPTNATEHPPPSRRGRAEVAG